MALLGATMRRIPPVVRAVVALAAARGFSTLVMEDASRWLHRSFFWPRGWNIAGEVVDETVGWWLERCRPAPVLRLTARAEPRVRVALSDVAAQAEQDEADPPTIVGRLARAKG